MENKILSLEERLDIYTDSYLKGIMRRLVLGYVMTHKLPWKKVVSESKKHYIINDAWEKPILTTREEDEAEAIILLGEAALERQKSNFPEGYDQILHLWKTIEREDKDIDHALRMEDENDFRNRPLIS